MSEVQDVSTPRAEVVGMQAEAAVCVALGSGTRGMRAQGKTYLPKWAMEDEDGWKARRDSTFLFPAYAKAIEKMVGRPFGEPVVVATATAIEAHLENVDLAGRDLDTFARAVFHAALRDGISWIVVDYQAVEKPFVNLAEEKAAGVRPYWVHVPLSRMIGWRTKTIQGKVSVRQVRYYESAEVEIGEWGVATEQRIRVLYPGSWQLWACRDDKWIQIEKGLTTLAEIPMVPVYTERTGFWTAKPPMAELAEKNVQHWQGESDLETIMHAACVPLLTADEDLREDKTAPVMVGARGMIIGFPNIKWTELQGTAIEKRMQRTLDIEDQMSRIAGERLESKVAKTATESIKEASEGASWLKVIARNFQDNLEECLRLHALWMKETTVSTVTVNCEWDDAKLTADVMTALSTMRSAGQISQFALTSALSDGGRLPEGRTVEDELADLEAEGPVAMAPGPLPQ